MKVKDLYWAARNSTFFINLESDGRPLLCEPRLSDEGGVRIRLWLRDPAGTGTGGQPSTGRGGEMSKSNCEPALLSSLETLQHNLQDAGMLRMKASLYSEAAVREALGDSEYRRISEKLDRRALLAQLDAVSLFLLQVLGLVSVGEGDGDLLSAEADVMNGAGEFPHLFAFCMIPEPSGATGSDTEIVERFVKRLSLCLH